VGKGKGKGYCYVDGVVKAWEFSGGVFFSLFSLLRMHELLGMLGHGYLASESMIWSI